jgi:hypothetical protein
MTTERNESTPLEKAIEAVENAVGPKLRGWQQMYYRMKRARARAQGATEIDDQTVDDYYAFFVWCYHLKDWLQKDLAVPLAAQKAVEPFVRSERLLGISGDLTNGVKHLLRDEGKASRRRRQAHSAGLIISAERLLKSSAERLLKSRIFHETSGCRRRRWKV